MHRGDRGPCECFSFCFSKQLRVFKHPPQQALARVALTALHLPKLNRVVASAEAQRQQEGYHAASKLTDQGIFGGAEIRSELRAYPAQQERGICWWGQKVMSTRASAMRASPGALACVMVTGPLTCFLEPRA